MVQKPDSPSLAPSLQVEVVVQIESLTLPDLPADSVWQFWFSRWLHELKPQVSPLGEYEIGLQLTDDKGIQNLNQQYRQQNRPTDVLAFATLDQTLPVAEELLLTLPFYLGDLVISLETAQIQAQQQQHPLEQELAWLAAHGLLHLLGWDHSDADSLTCMVNQQNQLLQLVGIAPVAFQHTAYPFEHGIT